MHGLYAVIYLFVFHIFQLPVSMEAKKRRAPKGTTRQLTLTIPFITPIILLLIKDNLCLTGKGY